MLTLGQLLSFDANTYSTVIEKWGQAADAINSASNTIASIGGQTSSWTGPAADQALATLGDLVAVVASSPGLINDAQDTVAAFAAAVNQQKEIATSAVKTAESLGCTVSADGTLTPPPQPSGEPPQVCFSDPVQEAARMQAQEAYDRSPAVQNWQTAMRQAPGLQARIQEALHAATAADSRAASDLEAGIRGGMDVQKIVTGHDPSGSYALNLYADTQKLADGQVWVQGYVKQAASLLPESAKGDSAAAAQLEVLAPLAYDQDFAASLMNQLGAAGLEQLPVEMGQHLQDLAPGDPPDLPQVLSDDQAVLRFLGDSLASASNSPNLSGAFIEGLTSNDSALAAYGRAPGPSGFWALGQILGATTTNAAPYDPQFLNTVGTAIINFDRQQDAVMGYEDLGPFFFPWANNLNLPMGAVLSVSASFHGVTDSGGDPIYGLMHAVALSPAAALTLFSSHANLSAVLTQLPWNFDQGSALGRALQAAAHGPGKVTALLTSNIVHILGLQYQHDSGYAAQMSGLNAHVADILAQRQNIMAINQAIAGNIQPGPDQTWSYPHVNGQGGIGPGFNGQELAVVLGTISQSPSAYETLQAAQVSYLRDELDSAVAAAMAIKGPTGGISGTAGSSLIEQTLGQGIGTLAFLSGVKTVVAQQAANASAAARQQFFQNASFVTQAISVGATADPATLPLSIVSGLVSTGLGAMSARVQASQAPTVAGAQEQLSLPDFGSIALANALLTNHAAPPSDLGNPAGKFWGANGQVLPNLADLTPQQQAEAIAAMNGWFDTLKTVGPLTYNQIMANERISGFDTAGTSIQASGS